MGGDAKEHDGTSEGKNRSSNVNVACFNNGICYGKAENSTPSFHTPPQQNDGMKKEQCQSHSKGPASHPKEEVPEGTSSESKMIEGEINDDPSSLLSSEKSLPSSESGSDSFYSTSV